jgi:hypothetical protein
MDFRIDRDALKGIKVQVTAQLYPLGDLAVLGAPLSGTSVFIDIKELSREQRKVILERCNNGCEALVKGRVDTVLKMPGLIVEDVTIHP